MNRIKRETWEAFREGDISAYNNIFITYSRDIRVFVDRLIHSHEDAKEITQDVFIKLWNNRTALEPDQNIKALIFTMAKNFAFNFIRDRKTKETYLNDFGRLNDSSSILEDDLTNQYSKLLINLAIATLPKRQKRIFLMSHERGLSNDDIALELNISKRSVENSLSLTRAIFREVIYIYVLYLSVNSVFSKLF